MPVKKLFRPAIAILAATVLAATAFASLASAHSVDKVQTMTFEIPATKGGTVTLLGQQLHIPKSFGGTGTLAYTVQGQTSDVIVSEDAAADDCSGTETPFIGVDMVGAGGTLSAEFTLNGSVKNADGSTQPYSASTGDPANPNDDLRASLPPGGTTEVLAICTEFGL